MDERQKQTWALVKLRACNAFIVVVVVLIFMDGFPFTAPQLRRLINAPIHLLAINQGEWSMFAPEPDTFNARLSADIEYEDGTMAQWQSPDWRRMPYFQRFLACRQLEYLEKAGNLGGANFWPGLVQYIVRTHPGSHPDSHLKHIKIWTETAEIPSLRPSAEVGDENRASPVEWRTWVEPPPFGEKEQLHQWSPP